MTNSYEFIEGTPGVTEDDITHLIIPSRYRGPDGLGLGEISQQRVDTAAAFFIDHALDGFIICSGYKNPADKGGTPWRDPIGREFEGQPEAYGMLDRLRSTHPGVDPNRHLVEPFSIDTVTNMTLVQHLLDIGPDERPVGIVAHQEHLERILDIIAPRTLKQPFAGIMAPEVPGHPDKDPRGVRLVSRWVTRGLTPDTPNITEIAERRILKIYGVVLAPQALKEHLGGLFDRKTQEVV
ncbi:MAG TPA: ElyC/SanA/YdcF family protein [Verrucomicrobiae bacterium]|nr:ElyC/SanA/YdcF family protein [Verrucomicrobiae bacterium]